MSTYVQYFTTTVREVLYLPRSRASYPSVLAHVGNTVPSTFISEQEEITETFECILS